MVRLAYMVARPSSLYIRAVTTKGKDGGIYTKHQLVESYWSEKGPRQRIIATLTDFTLEKPLWLVLARVISARLARMDTILEQDLRISAYADLVMTKLSIKAEIGISDLANRAEAGYENIDLGSANHTKVRSLGGELISNHSYELLGFEEILRGARLGEPQRKLAKAVILARLIHPGSHLSTHRFIKESSSLVEICG
jgi:hypothetical protein